MICFWCVENYIKCILYVLRQKILETVRTLPQVLKGEKLAAQHECQTNHHPHLLDFDLP